MCYAKKESTCYVLFHIFEMAEVEESVVSPIMGLEKFNFKKSEFVLFKERLEQTFIVNNVTGMERKRAILLSSLNEESYKLLRDLCTPISPALKSYEDIIKILMDFSRQLNQFSLND